MTIEKLTAGTKGDSQNSTGADIASSVNSLIDLTKDTQSRKYNNSIVLLGDSITLANQSGTETTLFVNDNGYFTVANYLMNSAFNVLNNAGVSSETTAQILARVDTDVLPYNPKYCIVLAGTNDLGAGLDIDFAYNNLIAMIDKLTSADIIPIMCTIPATTGIAFLDDWYKINTRLRNYAFDNDTLIVDFASSYLDADNVTSPFHIPNATSDGIHPNRLGAYLMGLDLRDVLQPLIKTRFVPVAGNNNPHDAVDNSLMTGTGGTFAGGATGVAPDGWLIFAVTVGVGATVVSEIVDKVSHKECKVTVAGGSTLTEVRAQLNAPSGTTPTEAMRAFFKYALAGGVNVRGLGVTITYKNVALETLWQEISTNQGGDLHEMLTFDVEGAHVFKDTPIMPDVTNYQISLKWHSLESVVTFSQPSIAHLI